MTDLWSAGEKITAAKLNQMCSKGINYLIQLNSGTYEAIDGATATVMSSSATDGATVLNYAINALPTNSLGGKQGVIALKDPTLDLQNTITVPAYSKIVLIGYSPNDDYAMQSVGSCSHTGGTILRYTKAAAGNILTVTAGGTNAEPHSMCSWLGLKNITLRYSNRSYTGKALDLSGAYGFELENVVCDVEWAPDGANAPVAASYGVYVPFTGGERRTMKNVVAVGYAVGMYLVSDHLATQNIEAYYCTRGIEFDGGSGQTHQYIHTAYCNYHIYFGATDLTPLWIGTHLMEDNAAVAWLTGTFYGYYTAGAGKRLFGTMNFCIESIADTRVADWLISNNTTDIQLHVFYRYTVQAGPIGGQFDVTSPFRGGKFDTATEFITFRNDDAGIASLVKGGCQLNSSSRGLGIKDADSNVIDFEKGRINQAQKGVAVALGAGATTATVTLPVVEPNGGYGVLITPSWGTTVCLPSGDKSATEFKVTFGTATPDANQVFHWFLFK